MKKTVGIILRENIADYKDIQLYACRRDLVQFLRKYDINIVGIPIVFGNKGEFKNIKELVDFCDGVISPGGNKIYDIDYELIKYLHEINKPTLGICLGMQIIGKLFNGKVRIGIDGGMHCREEKYVHNIIIKRDSILYKIIGKEKIKVNSRHFKQIPYTDLEGVAYSEDNVLEAIEDKSKKFFMGVQWHPESLIDDVYSNRLFDYFIKEL